MFAFIHDFVHPGKSCMLYMIFPQCTIKYKEQFAYHKFLSGLEGFKLAYPNLIFCTVDIGVAPSLGKLAW